MSELEPVTISEVGTKLDLARAYVDMGDPGRCAQHPERGPGRGQRRAEAGSAAPARFPARPECIAGPATLVGRRPFALLNDGPRCPAPRPRHRVRRSRLSPAGRPGDQRRESSPRSSRALSRVADHPVDAGLRPGAPMPACMPSARSLISTRRRLRRMRGLAARHQHQPAARHQPDLGAPGAGLTSTRATRAIGASLSLRASSTGATRRALDRRPGLLGPRRARRRGHARGGQAPGRRARLQCVPRRGMPVAIARARLDTARRCGARRRDRDRGRRANAFLHHMVRNIAGSLIAIGTRRAGRRRGRRGARRRAIGAWPACTAPAGACTSSACTTRRVPPAAGAGARADPL